MQPVQVLKIRDKILNRVPKIIQKADYFICASLLACRKNLLHLLAVKLTLSSEGNEAANEGVIMK